MPLNGAAYAVFRVPLTDEEPQTYAEQRAAALGNDAEQERTGVCTSEIVAVAGERKIALFALFFIGARHAGENVISTFE